MKKFFLYLFFLTFSVSCFAQKKSAKSIEDWKKIENANAMKSVFDNSVSTFLKQDTTFVDAVFKETFVGIEMYWGEGIDKYSFITQNKGNEINVKCVDVYVSSGNIFLAIVYYNENKNDFYEKHYYENGKQIVIMASPRGMRVIENDLSQFFVIIKSIMSK